LSVDVISMPRSAAPSVAERWYVLIVMCMVYAINIAARYVVTTVFEPIRLELHLTDAGAAFLTGVPLALFYVVFGMPIAWFADRSNRRNIVAAALIIWSGFTVLCGLSQTYLQLLLGRIGVGVGEAGATPPSTSIVSDCFPPERRPMALSVLALGAPIGAWMGADLAGAVAQAFGWRSAFFALGVPGLLLGVLVFLTLREPKRGRLDAIGGEGKPSFIESLRFLWRQKAAFHVIMASGVCSLWGLGSGLVDTDLSHAHLQSQCRPSGRGHRSCSPGGGDIRDSRHGLANGTSLHGESAPRPWNTRRYHRIGDHSVVFCVLDADVVGGEVDVLALHSLHLFLHRPLHGIGAEPGAEQHALGFYRVVGTGRKCIQSDRRAAGGRLHERLVRGWSRSRCRVIAFGFVGTRTHWVLGGLALLVGREDGCRGSDTRHRLHNGVRTAGP
jgi:hypothetical protein